MVGAWFDAYDESEKLFRADKSYLGNDVFRNAYDEAVEAKSLVEFVALIIRNRIFTYFDEAVEQGIKRQNYLTVPAAIKELEKIELVRQSDGRYYLDHAVTATQKVILNAVGLRRQQYRIRLRNCHRNWNWRIKWPFECEKWWKLTEKEDIR